MSSLNRSHILIACLLAMAFYFLFFHRLGARDLWNSHEARAAMNAQSILQGHALVPQLANGHPELQKPPLYYWLVAAMAQTTGATVSAWHVRLPSTLSALGCLVLLVWFGWKRGQTQAGFLAALILATALHFTWLARVGRIDMPLTLFIAMALCCFYVSLQEARRWPYQLLAYLSLSAAVLLKGPIGLVLPGAVLFLWLSLDQGFSVRQWPRQMQAVGLWWGLPLLLLCTVPWFVLANQQTQGDFFHRFFWLHNIQRGFGGSRLREHPWWRYAPQFFFDFLPWSLFLIPAVWRYCRHARFRLSSEQRFGLVWFGTMMVLLSMARYKRADYLMPLYPGAALFLGCAMAQWHPRQLRIVFGTVLVLCTLGWYARVEHYLPQVEPYREHQRFAAQVLRHCEAQNELLFFRTESHPLAFHVRRSHRMLLYWQDLDRWPCREEVFVIMSKKDAAQWPRHLKERRLEPLACNSDPLTGEHEKPLVLLRLHRSNGIPFRASVR